MDPADSDRLSRALVVQEEMLQRHDHVLQLITSQLIATTQQLAVLKGMLEATTSQASPNNNPPPPLIPQPEPHTSNPQQSHHPCESSLPIPKAFSS